MSTDLLDLDDSLDSSGLSHLTSQQKLRLTTLLDEYLQSLERGNQPDAERILADNPDIADTISQYLQKLEAIFGLNTHQRNNLAEVGDHELPFKQLGDFELIREIGRGGMGVVYEAKQTSIGRRVALKLLSLSSALNPKQIARFHNESRAAGLLQHPNIVPVYSVGMQQGIHFYAMQLIEGMSIDHWIECQRSISENETGPRWQEIVGWVAQIAEALHVAHEAGIVHRDIKPSNLLLDSTNHIWVTDFGLARCTQSSSVTCTGDLVGTVRYMSPEQAKGQAALVDGGSDIYGLAATLYEMLTFKPAIEGDEPTVILKHISERNTKPLRSVRRDLPRDLAVVIAKAMAHDRYDRYETAQVFADDLRRVLDNKPTVARPATLLERSVRWTVRHQRTASIAASVLGLLIVGLIVSFSLITAQKRQTDLIASRNARNEALARTMIDELGPQVAEILENVPSAERERRQLLEKFLNYYQVYAANAQHSPDTQYGLAIALGKMGILHGELGATEESLTALRESERVFSRLAKQNPTDLDLMLDWSVSLNNFGQALHRKGELREAGQLIQQALKVQNEIAKARESSDLNVQTASAWANLGLLLGDQNDLGSAEQAYSNSIRLMESLESEKTDVARALQLAKMRTNLSGLLIKVRPSDAVEVARKALAAEIAALELVPNHAKLSNQTVLTLNTLGAALTEDKQHRAALESYRQAEDIGQQLVNRWPEQPDYRSDLAASLNQMGVTYARLNRLAEGYDAFVKAQGHQRLLAEKFSSDAEVLSTTGSLLNNFAFLCQQTGRHDEALEAFRESVKFQSEAVRLAPQVRRYNEHLESHKANLLAAESKRR